MSKSVSPEEFLSAREALDLDRGQFAFMLGMDGANANDQMFRLERGKRDVMPAQARLIAAYLAGYRPDDWGSNGYAKTFAPIDDTGAGDVSTIEMTPEQVKAARAEFRLNLVQMGYMLGFEGTAARASMHRLESGERRIRPAQARLLRAYLSGYRPEDWGAYPTE